MCVLGDLGNNKSSLGNMEKNQQIPSPPPPSRAGANAANPTACHRPAAPFAISMLMDGEKAGSGECGKFALPKVALRKVAPKPLFEVGAIREEDRKIHVRVSVLSTHCTGADCTCTHTHTQNFDDTAYLIKPPTQMLRFIDALRYHKPTEEERSEWNVSSSTERLYLHLLNDVSLFGALTYRCCETCFFSK